MGGWSSARGVAIQVLYLLLVFNFLSPEPLSEVKQPLLSEGES